MKFVHVTLVLLEIAGAVWSEDWHSLREVTTLDRRVFFSRFIIDRWHVDIPQPVDWFMLICWAMCKKDVTCICKHVGFISMVPVKESATHSSFRSSLASVSGSTSGS